jgi:succinate dehydrogenase / fumarate reductase membrane anchor subunit
MRYSAVALVPLVWIHVLIQDILVGVHQINLDYVVLRWSLLGWQVYDILLLGFAFAHGMNGLRQVLNDYIYNKSARNVVSWVIFIAWIVITVIGGIAIVAAGQKHLAGL